VSIAFNQLPTEPLTQEMADACAKRIRRNPKDAKAIEKLVVHSLREAVIFLRDLSRGRLTDGELVSIAYKALERSARSYKPSKGHRFFYFAKKALRGVLIEHWRSLDTVKHSKNLSINWDNAVDSAKPRNKHPDIEDPETTSELEGRSEADFASIYRQEDYERVLRAMKCLSKFEKAIVMFVRATGFSFQETADVFGCSRAWVGICWNRAIDKLRAAVLQNSRL
jgi:RNA polymerase sigma factor (sigma-70 family)